MKQNLQFSQKKIKKTTKTKKEENFKTKQKNHISQLFNQSFTSNKGSNLDEMLCLFNFPPQVQGFFEKYFKQQILTI